jgi:cobalt-zinc-cadmium efflux system outer membrane protein
MRWLSFAVTLACALVHARASTAEEQDPACGGVLARSAVAPCAVSHSLVLRSEAALRVGLLGRRRAMTPIVPSNPTLSGSIARREVTGLGPLANWSVGLSQEIEVGGQRGLRLRAADEDVAAHDDRTLAIERGIVADAYAAYFVVLGAHAELELTMRLQGVANAVARATQAMADHGLASGVDSDIAEAVALRALRARIDAEGRLADAQVAFTASVGLDPRSSILDASGDLEPLSSVDSTARATIDADRPEIRALEHDARSWDARASTWARSRVPNVTLSAFLQDDGLHEQVIGFGVSLPVPFPQPVGRTYDGEIAESRALAERSHDEAARVRLELNASVLRALAEYDARIRSRDAVPAEKLERAEKTLQSIADEVTASRLATRDAVVAQQALVDLLLDASRARVAACLASVELARAAGLPLEAGGL